MKHTLNLFIFLLFSSICWSQDDNYTPPYYRVIDSVSSNYYQNQLRSFNFHRNIVRDSSILWIRKSSPYWNYFIAGINLLVEDERLKEIWLEGLKNDPCSNCESINNSNNLIDPPFNYFRTAREILFYTLREKAFFDKHCNAYYAQQSEEVKSRLEEILELDQKNGRDLDFKELKKIDDKNLKEVTEIISKLGKYPGRAIAGKKLEDVAWLVIQHSKLDSIEKYLPFVKEAVKEHDLHPKYLGYTLDKINILKELPQKYGTQFYRENGKNYLYELEDPVNVTKFRKSIGMISLELYMKDNYIQEYK